MSLAELWVRLCHGLFTYLFFSRSLYTYVRVHEIDCAVAMSACPDGCIYIEPNCAAFMTAETSICCLLKLKKDVI